MGSDTKTTETKTATLAGPDVTPTTFPATFAGSQAAHGNLVEERGSGTFYAARSIGHGYVSKAGFPVRVTWHRGDLIDASLYTPAELAALRLSGFITDKKADAPIYSPPVESARVAAKTARMTADAAEIAAVAAEAAFDKAATEEPTLESQLAEKKAVADAKERAEKANEAAMKREPAAPAKKF
jgi:hypothetical protein